jgi:hypothetical protein
MTRVFHNHEPESERAMGRCEYCERLCFRKGSKKALADPFCIGTRDHVIPKMLRTQESFDAVESPDNIVLSCSACNQIKHDAPPEPFRAWRKENREPGIGANRKAFQIYLFALTEIGWRKVRDDAAWGPPASTMGELAAKVARVA